MLTQTKTGMPNTTGSSALVLKGFLLDQQRMYTTYLCFLCMWDCEALQRNIEL